MKQKKDIMVRMNSWIYPHQHKFIKELAKKLEKGEGETHREIIDYYIKKHDF